MKKFLDDFIRGSTSMLYPVVMIGFSAALVMALPMAVRFIARQFLSHWSRIRELRREKMNGARKDGATKTDPTDYQNLQKVREGDENRTISPFWPHENRISPSNFPLARPQSVQGGLHPGGKEFFLLRSKNPICETAGWIAIL